MAGDLPSNFQPGGCSNSPRILSISSRSLRNPADVSANSLPISGHWAPCPLKTMAMGRGDVGALTAVAVLMSSPSFIMANDRYWRFCR